MIVVSPRHPARPTMLSVRRLRRTVTLQVVTIDTIGGARFYPFGNGRPPKRLGPATRERRKALNSQTCCRGRGSAQRGRLGQAGEGVGYGSKKLPPSGCRGRPAAGTLNRSEERRV